MMMTFHQMIIKGYVITGQTGKPRLATKPYYL
jgi:hypothetical protein